ncbi:uncharacterized protein TNCV_1778361 [Trichonephila clavipes]|nr:uncharacterized protein TNCV_1778361 [Trichonephila clavipes]
MKIGNNGNLVLGPFDESTPCLMIVLMNCQTKLRINHLTALKSVAILENLKYTFVDDSNDSQQHKPVKGQDKAEGSSTIQNIRIPDSKTPDFEYDFNEAAEMPPENIQSARRLRMVREDTGAPYEGATCAWMVTDEAVGCTRAFLTMWRSSQRLICRGRPEPGLRVNYISRIHWFQHLTTQSERPN